VALAGCDATPASTEVADVVYTNGHIYTVDEAQPWAEALAIKDGRFVAVGSNADIESLLGAGTEAVDLEGAFVMPGIVDLHVHPFATPLFNVINLDFSDPFDVDRMMDELAVFADANPGKRWLRGGSYGLGVFPGDNPRKEVIDAVVSDRPVVLIDQTGHNYWVNSLALELAGIDADTPTDDKVVIEKDPVTGEPTGTLRESAMRLIEQVADWPTSEENYEAFAEVFRRFNSQGVTTMRTAEGNTRWLDVIRDMDAAGDLEMRLFVSWDWHMHLTTPFTDDEMDAQIEERGRYASDLLSANSVKIFLDGTPIGYQAPYLEPYEDGSGEYGVGKFTPDELAAVVLAFDQAGVGLMMHSIGDASARMALDAVEAARETNGPDGPRHSIVHLMSVHPDDVPRFAQIPGVFGELSPAATYPLPAHAGVIPMIGEERYQNVYPARSLLDSGAVFGYGSDWLTLIPPSPWMPMQGFLSRANPDHPELGTLNQDETITIEEAIRVFTLNGAHAVGAEDRIGSIEVGKDADLIVLDRDLLETDPSAIRDTEVLRTVLRGKVIFER
jgi:predicted amidohydrolase YtcJ